ncbi:hypothetical protein BaOVIS_011410 [Babesia ovis]|uniref:Uncharacterized protein n=1 Tax=Babesia ovis TaxID=5869 RepID=A0A9W5T9E8_BABOV|nr:hypothetical protein BaOVIS_011410 [Babesia ovis]
MESNSVEDLDSVFKVSKSLLDADGMLHTPKLRYEYVVSGIFKDPTVSFDPSAVLSPETTSDSDSPRLCDPIFDSTLYRDFLNTLSHLMETQRLESYERLVYSRGSVARSHSAINFTSNVATGETKTLELFVHKDPSPLAGQCTMFDLHNHSASTSSADVVTRSVGGMVGVDMVSVLPIYGFTLTKRMFVCGHVFSSNYGNPMHMEIAVLRHYLDCNPKTPLLPNCLLVELRCRGDGDIDMYKSRLRDYTRLLYNYVEFSFE